MRTEKERFQEIANVIAGNVQGIERIFLDEFEFEGIDYSYLVVSFKSGALSVRNCKYNSLTDNIREVAAMLNGVYYREVESYAKLRPNIAERHMKMLIDFFGRQTPEDI